MLKKGFTVIGVLLLFTGLGIVEGCAHGPGGGWRGTGGHGWGMHGMMGMHGMSGMGHAWGQNPGADHSYHGDPYGYRPLPNPPQYQEKREPQENGNRQYDDLQQEHTH